nr:hypothetical protein [bacterium]
MNFGRSVQNHHVFEYQFEAYGYERTVFIAGSKWSSYVIFQFNASYSITTSSQSTTISGGKPVYNSGALPDSYTTHHKLTLAVDISTFQYNA